jgi:hypothetical protein
MKAKDLIKILEQNPEQDVKIYNGFVDDWMDIEIYTFELVKEKPSTTLNMINYQNQKKGLPLWDKLQKGKYKIREWEFKNSFVDYEKYKKDYSFKSIFLLQGKSRNKSIFDRFGTIKY